MKRAGDHILEAAPSAPSADGPCQCWDTTFPLTLHAGHCCFLGASFDVEAGRAVCGHDEEGMERARAAADRARIGAPRRLVTTGAPLHRD